MFSDRLAVSIFLIPLAAWFMAVGGLPFLGATLFVLIVAAREYAGIFRAGRYRPAEPLLLLGVPLLVIARQYPGLNPDNLLVTLGLLACLTWHLVDYERGAPASGTDFAVTVGGLFYLGWLGGLFIALRLLPHGDWWLVTILTATWLADTGAYLVGRRLGKHPMAPRLSPKKSWEGYAGGVALATLGEGLLAAGWSLGAGPDSGLTWQTGMLIGLLVGLLSPLGDLGVSMLKRQSGVKDAGHLIAGHGGVLDRIDSWLVSVPVGYFLVLLLFH